jgi:hypothetical protein
MIAISDIILFTNTNYVLHMLFSLYVHFTVLFVVYLKLYATMCSV